MNPGFAFRFPLAGGLHARPAAALRERALPFEAQVAFHNDRSGRSALLANLLDLLATDTRPQDPCRITAEGAQARAALADLEAFVAGAFLDCDGAPEPWAGQAGLGTALGRILAGAPVLEGLPVAPGAGWGPAILARAQRPDPESFPFPSEDPRGEAAALRDARTRAVARLRREAHQAGGPARRGILEAQAAMAQDETWLSGLEADLRAGYRAPAALLRAVRAGRARLEAAPSPLLRARALDLEDLGDRLLAECMGTDPGALVLGEPGVLVAGSLTPSRLLGLDRSLLQGLVLGEGGEASHTAILARSFGIPCVVCAGAARVRPGQPVLVDGERGLVVPDPAPALLDYYRIQARERSRRGPAEGATADGTRVALLANILSPQEAQAAFDAGAEGIGLFRTEMLFMDRSGPPSEEEQAQAYRQVLEAAGDRPVVLRLLDVGGDKPLPYLPLGPEANPFLGVRGVRWYGRHPELVASQLRAAARAAAHGDLRLLVPMVSDLEEIRQVRALAQAAGAGSLPLGIMVEVPAAALNLAALAREADFLSVGSNDLVQYLFAADRGDGAVSRAWHGWHPATLRLLAGIVDAAAAAGRPVSLCGELAGWPELQPLLVGLGFRSLSMAPGLLEPARRSLALVDAARCRERAALALEAGTADAVLEVLRSPSTLRAGDLMDPDLVVLDEACASKEAALKLLAERLAALGRARDPLALEEALWARELTCATGVGHGFAVPHCKSPAVATPSLAVLRLRSAVPWGGPEANEADVLILLASGEDGGDGHLRVFARLARKLMDPDIRHALRGAADPGAVLALLRTEVLPLP